MATKQTLLLLANSPPLVAQGAQTQRLWADTGLAPPARTPCPWHQVPAGAPPRGGHRICSLKAPQVMPDLEPGTQLLCLQQRSVIWFDTLHVFFAQIRSFFFAAAPQHRFLWRWLTLDLVGMAWYFLFPLFLGKAGLLQSAAATGEMVWWLWQHLPKALCGLRVLNLPISVTDCSASVELGVSKLFTKK